MTLRQADPHQPSILGISFIIYLGSYGNPGFLGFLLMGIFSYIVLNQGYITCTKHSLVFSLWGAGFHVHHL